MTYRIEEGSQWLVAKLSMEGIEEADAAGLLPRLSDAPGEPYSSVDLDSDRNLILSYYYQHGFPRAEVVWMVTPAVQLHQVDLLCRVMLRMLAALTKHEKQLRLAHVTNSKPAAKKLSGKKRPKN